MTELKGEAPVSWSPTQKSWRRAREMETLQRLFIAERLPLFIICSCVLSL